MHDSRDNINKIKNADPGYNFVLCNYGSIIHHYELEFTLVGVAGLKKNV
jgi:carbonic anhydrase